MIKVTAPLFENWLNPEHDNYLLVMRDANAQAEIVASTARLNITKRSAESMNRQTSDDYPRWIGVSASSCWIDPEGRKPARIPVRHKIALYDAPTALRAIILAGAVDALAQAKAQPALDAALDRYESRDTLDSALADKSTVE